MASHGMASCVVRESNHRCHDVFFVCIYMHISRPPPSICMVYFYMDMYMFIYHHTPSTSAFAPQFRDTNSPAGTMQVRLRQGSLQFIPHRNMCSTIYIYNHFPFGCHFASRPYIYIVYIMVCMPCHGESGEYRFSCLGWNAHQSVLFLGLCFYDIVCPGAK